MYRKYIKELQAAQAEGSAGDGGAAEGDDRSTGGGNLGKNLGEVLTGQVTNKVQNDGSEFPETHSIVDGARSTAARAVGSERSSLGSGRALSAPRQTSSGGKRSPTVTPEIHRGDSFNRHAWENVTPQKKETKEEERGDRTQTTELSTLSRGDTPVFRKRPKDPSPPLLHHPEADSLKDDFEGDSDSLPPSGNGQQPPTYTYTAPTPTDNPPSPPPPPTKRNTLMGVWDSRGYHKSDEVIVAKPIQSPSGGAHPSGVQPFYPVRREDLLKKGVIKKQPNRRPHDEVVSVLPVAANHHHHHIASSSSSSSSSHATSTSTASNTNTISIISSNNTSNSTSPRLIPYNHTSNTSSSTSPNHHQHHHHLQHQNQSSMPAISIFPAVGTSLVERRGSRNSWTGDTTGTGNRFSNHFLSSSQTHAFSAPGSSPTRHFQHNQKTSSSSAAEGEGSRPWYSSICSALLGHRP